MHEVQVNQVPAVACVSSAEAELVERVVIGGIYEHYRNKQHYRVVSIGRHTETEELMVVY